MDKKPLRQTMPTVAAWVDELRAAFGADAINPAIRNGAAGGSYFYAEENGHAIGCEAIPGGQGVNAAQMVLASPDQALRCPFCGGEGIEVVNGQRFGGAIVTAKCTACGATHHERRRPA